MRDSIDPTIIRMTPECSPHSHWKRFRGFPRLEVTIVYVDMNAPAYIYLLTAMSGLSPGILAHSGPYKKAGYTKLNRYHHGTPLLMFFIFSIPGCSQLLFGAPS